MGKLFVIVFLDFLVLSGWWGVFGDGGGGGWPSLAGV